MKAVEGVTLNDSNCGGFTVTEAEALIDPEVAVTVEDPVARLESDPPELILATEIFELVQVMVVVTSRLLPSLKRPVAENSCPFPRDSVTVAGLIVIDVRAAPPLVFVVPLPLVAPMLAAPAELVPVDPPPPEQPVRTQSASTTDIAQSPCKPTKPARAMA